MEAQKQKRLLWRTSDSAAMCRCGMSHTLEDEDVVQIIKKKVSTAEEGRGRFKSTASGPLRIADREKKAALKT